MNIDIENKDELSNFLFQASLDHRDMLRAVHACGKELYRPGADLDCAIARYLSWLPGLKIKMERTENSDSEKIPIDIAWIWHVHKLDPASYKADCLQWFGCLLDVPVGMSPFAVSPTEDTGAPISSAGIGFDTTAFHARIVDRALLQGGFLWQVRHRAVMLIR